MISGGKNMFHQIVVIISLMFISKADTYECLDYASITPDEYSRYIDCLDIAACGYGKFKKI